MEKRKKDNRIGWKISALVVVTIFLLVTISTTLVAQTWGTTVTENDSYRIVIDGDDDSTSESFSIFVDGTSNEVFRVQEDGLVGIGTASPLYALDVNFEDNTYNDNRYGIKLLHEVQAGSTAAANLGTGILFDLEDTSGGSESAASITAQWDNATVNNQEGLFVFRTMDKADDGLGIRMVIDKDGKTGIGVHNPDAMLQVFHPHTTTNNEVTSFKVSANTQTITSNLGNARACQFIEPTITSSSSTTITNAATVYIRDDVTSSGSATITNNYALWVDDGNVRFDGDARIVGNVGIGVAAPLTKLHINGDVAFGVGSQLTISSSDEVTITHSYHPIDTYNETTSTDDLDTIKGGDAAGQILIIRAANNARTVVAKDGTGNLRLSGDFSMDNILDTLVLMYIGNAWIELSRSDNGT